MRPLFRQLLACKSNLRCTVGNGFSILSLCNLFPKENDVQWSHLEETLLLRTLSSWCGETTTVLQSTRLGIFQEL